MPTSTRKNGITLIALIITIIVMLILVGVTINVALNGGLFDKAKNAADQTNFAKDKELVQCAALGYLNTNGKIDTSAFILETGKESVEGYELTLKEDGKYVQATKGDNIFYVDENGGILDKLPEPQVETNPWKLSPRNLNSSNVRFNVRYSIIGSSDSEDGIILYDDGRFYFAREFSNSEIETYISGGYVTTGSNYLLVPFGENSFCALVFDNVGSLKKYIAPNNVNFNLNSIIEGDSNGPDQYNIEE